ncbi:MAG: hypothetical protein CM1200mP20_08000 [Pseudomonadota bacterium]|nr:MAG: hypothetical protein CM1200mP20_08000 [Pseudomonadota bacterium]
MTSDVLLGIQGLHKSFGGVAATNQVTLDILDGEVHAIIGPNGAGKTTLVSQLTGVLMPDAGEITFRGNDITYMPAYRRPHLGMARSFQITSIIHDMTVLENVLLAVQAKTGHSYRFWRSADSDPNLTGPAMDALRGVGLEDQAMQIAGPLSHGEHRQFGKRRWCWPLDPYWCCWTNPRPAWARKIQSVWWLHSRRSKVPVRSFWWNTIWMRYLLWLTESLFWSRGG